VLCKTSYWLTFLFIIIVILACFIIPTLLPLLHQILLRLDYLLLLLLFLLLLLLLAYASIL
jgi:hypothetical protein